VRIVVPFYPGGSLRSPPAKGSHRNKFTFWRERRAGEAPRRGRCQTSSRIPSFARDAPLPRIAGQTRLALLLAPHIPPPGRVLLVARASPAGPAGLQQNANQFLCEP